jgi:hypothetical protein
MKKAIKILSVFYILILSSCTKEVPTQLPAEQDTQNAIKEIRKIIGSQGTIIIKDAFLKNYIQSESMLQENNSIRKLSIDEFKKVYNVFKNKQVSFNSFEEVNLDSLKDHNRKKSEATFNPDDDTLNDFYGGVNNKSDDPRPAGFYTTTFRSELLEYYLRGYIDGNNPFFLSSINVQYRTDGTGRIVGMPNLYFSGLSIFNWTQNYSQLMSFESQNFKSVFLISGITNYNISFGPLVFNVSSSNTFRVTLYMDDSSKTIARIEILESETKSM